MKSILLASASVFAFAGAAAADGHTDLNVTGDAEVGYNDDDAAGNTGMYWGAGLGVSGSTALDNGITAGFTLDVDLNDVNADNDTFDLDTVSSSDFVLSLSTDTASLDFGDTAPSADRHWSGAGDMENDGFAEAEDAPGEDAQLVGEYTFGDVTGSLSYAVVDTGEGNTTDDDLTAMQFAAVADMGQFGVTVAYQDDDNAGGEIFGLSVGTTFSGADIRVAYATDQTADENSFGVEGSYPFGPVTASAYFVAESAGDDNYGVSVDYAEGPLAVGVSYANEQGTDVAGVEGSYDVGNGLTVLAGYLTEDGSEDRFYVAGDYDLGGGAGLLVSYADDDDDVDEDEIGAPEYQRGTTVEVSFEF